MWLCRHGHPKTITTEKLLSPWIARTNMMTWALNTVPIILLRNDGLSALDQTRSHLQVERDTGATPGNPGRPRPFCMQYVHDQLVNCAPPSRRLFSAPALSFSLVKNSCRLRPQNNCDCQNSALLVTALAWYRAFLTPKFSGSRTTEA